MKDIVINLTFVRHGQVPANKEKRYIGKTDEDLSNDGVLELERLYSTHKFEKVDYLFSSPMLRCRRTCDILFPNVPYTVIDEFTEMNFGKFEMKNYNDLKNDTYYQKWIDSNGTLPFPDGESQSQFIKRCMSGFDKTIEYIFNSVSISSGISGVDNECINNGSKFDLVVHSCNNSKNCEYSYSLSAYDSQFDEINVACVVHGGTIMAIMSTLENGNYYDYQVKNGEFIVTFLQLHHN